MNKKNWIRDTFFVFFGVSVFLFMPISRAQDLQPTWQKYLEHLKNDAFKDYMGDLNQLKLLKYAYKGKIRSEKHKSRLIETICSDKAATVSLLPNLVISDTTFTNSDVIIHQKIYPNFEIVTVRQMVNSGKLTEDSIAMIKQRLYENVRIGFDYLELEWSYKGKRFRCLSIVSSDGIPTDFITSRLYTRDKKIINSRNSTNKK